MEVLNFMFSSGATFFGCLLLLIIAAIVLGMVLDYTRSFYTRTLRMIMVLCRGWSPSHLDADGDFRQN
jgi:hypothetical protein